MVFTVCGLNHKTAPLNVRETLALPVALQDTLLSRLLSLPGVSEATLLSTCNRTEIYCEAEDPTVIIPWLAQEHQLESSTITPYFYTHLGHDAVRHILSVAIGLDSMMLGEPQILGQMKQAYQQACRVGSVKRNLNQLFQYVFSASKRVRNLSGIGNNPVSIAFAGAQLIGNIFSDYSTLNVLLIGSGETAFLVAKYLRQHGVTRFMIASRTQQNANRLATKLNGEALSITDIPHYLSRADVVVSATACPLPFISKQLVTNAMNQRVASVIISPSLTSDFELCSHELVRDGEMMTEATRVNAPMFFLDLAVPRDIEPDVGELDGVHLYNIDDLQMIIEQGMSERRLAALEAEQLIEDELNQFVRWQRSLRANDAICDYRSQMKDLAQIELQRAMQKLSTGQCHYNVLTEFSERLVNKLTHTPTIGLRQAACDDREELLDLAQYLIKASIENPTHEEIT